MCVKSSNNSNWNSIILYNYQFVFIETISTKKKKLKRRLAVIINPSQHYARVEVSLIETHFPCQPLLCLYIIYGPEWSGARVVIHQADWGHLPIIVLDGEQYAFSMPCQNISDIFTLDYASQLWSPYLLKHIYLIEKDH